MHFEKDKIIGDTAEESLVIAEAEIMGITSWENGRYSQHNYFNAPKIYRSNLIKTLESEHREGQAAVVRGLSRIAMSQQKLKFVALDVLTQLADAALN